MRALIYLRLHLLKNGVLSVLTNPKRLVFAVFFVVWMAANLLMALGARLGGGMPEAGGLHIPEAHLKLGVIALLVMLTATAIERGLDGAVFHFSPADYDFVFPTPIARRLVVAARVLADAAGLLVWVGVFVLLAFAFSPLRWEGLSASPQRLLVVWVVGWLYAVLVVNLARIVELVFAGAEAALGSRVGVLKIAVWCIAIGTVAGAAYTIGRGAAESGAVLDMLGRPPLVVVFWPMLSLAALLGSEPTPVLGSLELTYGLLCALAAGCAVGVCLLDRDVIEVTLEHSARISRIRQAMRSQDADALTVERLQRAGGAERSFVVDWRHPAMALPYRVLAEASRIGVARVILCALAVVAPAAGAFWLPVEDDIIRLITGPVVAYALFLLASFHALRFRSELGHITILRALPAPEWQLLLGLSLPRPLGHSFLLILALAGIHLARPSADPQMTIAVALCVPLAAVTSSFVGAIAACLFPEGADAAQRFFGGLLHVAGMTIAFAPGIVLVVVGTVLRYPGAVTGIMGNLGLIPVAVVSGLLAYNLFRRFQPGDA